MIQGARCQCGKNIVPFRKLCPSCGKAMDGVEFEDAGTVLTHTTLYAPPQGFEAPVKLALVKLKGGANMICDYRDDSEVNIGDEIVVKRDGALYYCEQKNKRDV